jgi:hypothetical protein
MRLLAGRVNKNGQLRQLRSVPDLQRAFSRLIFNPAFAIGTTSETSP